jgi:hypothetical protein
MIRKKQLIKFPRKINFEFQLNYDENEIFDSIIRNNELQLIIQEEQEHVAKLKDQGLNELIMIGTSHQYLNLVMEE